MKKYVLPFVKIYWKVFRPRTFGVKVVILHPVKIDEFLMVRHSYGNQKMWNLPGGGYQPSKENVIQAALREVQEELYTDLVEPKILGEYYTTLQGKRDTVTFVQGTILTSDTLQKSGEIIDFCWIPISEISHRTDVATIVKVAIGKLTKEKNNSSN